MKFMIQKGRRRKKINSSLSFSTFSGKYYLAVKTVFQSYIYQTTITFSQIAVLSYFFQKLRQCMRTQTNLMVLENADELVGTDFVC